MLGSCFVMQYFVSFLVLTGEEGAGWFSLIVFWMPCGCCRTLPIPSGARGGLKFVIFAFLGHSHLLFYAFVCCFWISTFNSNCLIIHGKHKIVIHISFLQ